MRSRAHTQASKKSGKGKKSKSWSKSEPSFSDKGKSKENKGKSKGKSKGTKSANQGAKGLHKGKASKAGAPTYTTVISWNDGWNGDEWNDGWSRDEWNGDWSSVGWHEGCEQPYDNSTSSFSLGGLDLGAMSSPKRFEWVKMNLDTGAAVNTFPLNFGPDGAGDG